MIYMNLFLLLLLHASPALMRPTCSIEPLGDGQDDTDQIENAIAECGSGGTITFSTGSFNVTRKMTWDLQGSVVDLHGLLNFPPNIEYWLDADNTYRVVFIQSQASWFVLTGSNFVVDAHGTGGIQGNGQSWWEYGEENGREDGDGRPISLTVWQAKNATIRDFAIHSPPFWCNTVSESESVIYDGMLCNATNQNSDYYGKNIVPNTDGLNTYRSSEITLNNWDVTLGDDCLAIKGNSTNIQASNITCRGGNGIAIGSLGQYPNLTDIVENVVIDGVKYVRLGSDIQPNMKNGLYLKTWTGTQNGDPPNGGGGAPGGRVNNLTARNFFLDDMDRGVSIYQNNGAEDGDSPSRLKISNVTISNFTGTLTGNTAVNLACSSGAPCSDILFEDYDIETPGTKTYTCKNVQHITGLSGSCA